MVVFVVLRQHCIARPVDHQRLHTSSDRGLDLLDVVAEEEDGSRFELKQKTDN